MRAGPYPPPGAPVFFIAVILAIILTVRYGDVGLVIGGVLAALVGAWVDR